MVKKNIQSFFFSLLICCINIETEREKMKKPNRISILIKIQKNATMSTYSLHSREHQHILHILFTQQIVTLRAYFLVSAEREREISAIANRKRILPCKNGFLLLDLMPGTIESTMCSLHSMTFMPSFPPRTRSALPSSTHACVCVFDNCFIIQ